MSNSKNKTVRVGSEKELKKAFDRLYQMDCMTIFSARVRKYGTEYEINYPTPAYLFNNNTNVYELTLMSTDRYDKSTIHILIEDKKETPV